MDDSKSEFVCSDCGTPVRESAGVCPQCGAKLEWKEEAPEPDQSAEFACADCGASVAQADRVCPHCGADLEWGDNSHVPEHEAGFHSPSLAVPPLAVENGSPGCHECSLPAGSRGCAGTDRGRGRHLHCCHDVCCTFHRPRLVSYIDRGRVRSVLVNTLVSCFHNCWLRECRGVRFVPTQLVSGQR